MKAILFAAALCVASASNAQMGGSMSMGGASSNTVAAPVRKTLTSSQTKQWADCQAMAPEDMAKNMRCQSLKKKVDAMAKTN